MARRIRHAGRLLLLALAVGLVAGLAEALILWGKQALFGKVVFASRHLLWMTPAAYLILFGALGLLLAVMGVLAPRLVSVPLSVFATVSFGAGCLFLPVGEMHRIAQAVLAAGLGVQAYRMARDRPKSSARALVRTTLAMTALAGLAGVVGEIRYRTDSSGFSGPVSLRAAAVPNVVIVVWDTVRAASLSLYGHPRPTTPGLEKLAAESVVFDRAFSTSPWTLPSHATLFTGLFPHQTSVGWFDRLDDAAPTLAEIFRSIGHATGGFVANHHYTSYDSGLGRGFDVYRDYPVSFDQLIRTSAFTQASSGGRLVRARSFREVWAALRAGDWSVGEKRNSDRKHTEEVNGQLLEWVDGLRGQPFFAFLNLFDAHQPYWSPPEFVERMKGVEGPQHAYEAAIAYQDEQLSRLLDSLRQRGVLDETLVVVVSDHGELFGEHGIWGHASNVYLPVLHVPLLIRYPAGMPEGLRVSAEVSLRDVAATVLDVAGIDVGSAVPGESLARYWSDAAGSEPTPVLAEVEEGRNNPPHTPISRGPVKTLILEGWQYILNGDGVEELYRYANYAEQSRDRAADPSAAGRLDDLRSRLAELLPHAQPH